MLDIAKTDYGGLILLRNYSSFSWPEDDTHKTHIIRHGPIEVNSVDKQQEFCFNNNWKLMVVCFVCEGKGAVFISGRKNTCGRFMQQNKRRVCSKWTRHVDESEVYLF